jgi:hypothetical protein
VAIGPRRPLVIPARRCDAPIPVEGIAEHRLVGDALGTRIEHRRQIFQGLSPPIGNRTPAHRGELGFSIDAMPHEIDLVCGRNIAVSLVVTGARTAREFRATYSAAARECPIVRS